jgi:hypothetical protein
VEKRKESEQDTKGFYIGIVEEMFVKDKGWIKHKNDCKNESKKRSQPKGCKNVKEK